MGLVCEKADHYMIYKQGNIISIMNEGTTKLYTGIQLTCPSPCHEDGVSIKNT